MRYHTTAEGNIPFTAEEEAEAEASEAEWAAGQARREALKQIAELEATITTRRMREAALGTDNGWLANLDAQIQALRAQL